MRCQNHKFFSVVAGAPPWSQMSTPPRLARGSAGSVAFSTFSASGFQSLKRLSAGPNAL